MEEKTLKKDEILSLRKVISDTFEKRMGVSQFPFRIIINPCELPTTKPAQVLITVPKRNFKLAVDRNLIRRRIKEIYRHQKFDLYDYLSKNQMQLALIIIYIHNKELKYEGMEEKLIISLQKVIQRLDEIKISK